VKKFTSRGCPDFTLSNPAELLFLFRIPERRGSKGFT
jgi:hypothetical protein